MPDQPIRVLLVDDDCEYAGALSAYLTLHGCEVATLADPAELCAALALHRPDILLLDQFMGSVSGTDVLRRLRSETDLPCIIVTGRSETTERILHLELGADDEVDKSLPPRELLARLRAVLRRARPSERVAAEPGRGGWRFLPDRRELRAPDGTLCHLTTAEFEALRILHDHLGEAVSRAALCREVFGRAQRPGDRAVDTVIRKLRRKIQPPGGPECIKTVRPVGYVFVGFADRQPA